MIYLDNISGTPLHAEVKAAMVAYMDDGFGNPISQHRAGDEALEALERARQEVARLIGAEKTEIVFTSGGTESINHAVKGVALAMGEKGRHIVTSNIEHQSVLRSLRTLMRMGYRVTLRARRRVRACRSLGRGEGHNGRDDTREHHAREQRDRDDRAHRGDRADNAQEGRAASIRTRSRRRASCPSMSRRSASTS